MFRKLVCNDNWGYLEYSDKKEPKTLFNEELEKRVGKKVKVKFPNGVLRELPLLGMPRMQHISEQGGAYYTVHSTEYFLRASYEGIKVLIPVEEVYVNV